MKAGHAGRSERTEGDVPSLSSPGAPSLFPCGTATITTQQNCRFEGAGGCAISFSTVSDLCDLGGRADSWASGVASCS